MKNVERIDFHINSEYKPFIKIKMGLNVPYIYEVLEDYFVILVLHEKGLI